MTKEELFAEATSVYDNYVEALATGPSKPCSRMHEICPSGSFPRSGNPRSRRNRALLRDVLARSLFAKYQGDFTMLNRILML